MINGCDDEARISQCLRRVMMATEPAAPAVGEDDQRQLRPGDRTIPGAPKRVQKADGEATEQHGLRLCRAWIPDCACQAWSFQQLDPGALRRKSQTAQQCDIRQTCLEHEDCLQRTN